MKLTIYVLDAGEFKRPGKPIGAVYREYFGKHFPAMPLVGVRDLYDAADLRPRGHESLGTPRPSPPAARPLADA